MQVVLILIVGLSISIRIHAEDISVLQQVDVLIAESKHADAIAILESYVEQHPHDQTSSFTLARLYSWQKRWAESALRYDKLLAVSPKNVDFQLGKGQALLWQGDFLNAYITLDAARNVAPEYEQIWRDELRALEHLSSEPIYETKQSTLRMAAAERFSASDWRSTVLRTPFDPAQHWTKSYDSRVGYETLGPGRDPWRRSQIGMSMLNAARQSFAFSAGIEQRFGFTDSQVNVSAASPFKRAVMNGELLLSPTAHVLPSVTAAFQVAGTHFPSWSPLAGYRYNRYLVTGVHTLSLGAESYWKNFLVTYQAAAVFSDGYSTGSNQKVQAILFYGLENRFGINLARGTEIERLGMTTTRESEIASITGSFEYWASKNLGLIGQVNMQKQGLLYTRYGLELGFRYRP